MAKTSKTMLKNVRCIYPALHNPKAWPGQDTPRYSIKILIPKTDKAGVTALKTFINDAVGDTDWTAMAKKAVLKTALDTGNAFEDFCLIKDGDLLNERRKGEDKDIVEAYVGHYVISAGRRFDFGAPTVVDQRNAAIPPENISSEIRSGYWLNVQVGAYCYSKPKQGVSMQLLAVQLVKSDIEFGQSSPFDELESEESDGSDVDL